MAQILKQAIVWLRYIFFCCKSISDNYSSDWLTCIIEQYQRARIIKRKPGFTLDECKNNVSDQLSLG